MSKNLMVAKERVELSCPKASVSKTDAYPGSATWPLENTVGIEPTMDGFAIRRLTDWLGVQKLLRGNNNCTRRVATTSVPRSAVER
jgi:hypothetical protein